MVILVTGGTGQLGQALQSISGSFPDATFHFADSSKANITNKESLTNVFKAIHPDYCINAAAYTAVDKAESETENASLINVVGARNLAQVCHEFNAVLIHISTDFVFDGENLSQTPYTEIDVTNPQGVYGQTKRDGEIEVVKNLEKNYIIRTSWLYSDFGNNFMKTMLRLGTERSSLNVVNDQIGTPTHAVDLAKAIMKIIDFDSRNKSSSYGIYHFSNEGKASWFDFAAKIFELNNISIDLQPIATSQYPTPAKRPAFSVLDKSKIKAAFQLEIDDWETALKKYKQ